VPSSELPWHGRGRGHGHGRGRGWSLLFAWPKSPVVCGVRGGTRADGAPDEEAQAGCAGLADDAHGQRRPKREEEAWPGLERRAGARARASTLRRGWGGGEGGARARVRPRAGVAKPERSSNGESGRQRTPHAAKAATYPATPHAPALWTCVASSVSTAPACALRAQSTPSTPATAAPIATLLRSVSRATVPCASPLAWLARGDVVGAEAEAEASKLGPRFPMSRFPPAARASKRGGRCTRAPTPCSRWRCCIGATVQRPGQYSSVSTPICLAAKRRRSRANAAPPAQRCTAAIVRGRA
jgi:hypothetical protein